MSGVRCAMCKHWYIKDAIHIFCEGCKEEVKPYNGDCIKCDRIVDMLCSICFNQVLLGKELKE